LRQLHLRTDLVLDQLVHDAERRRVRARAESRPDAEAVDGRTALDQLRDAVLVEITRHEDADVTATAGVEDGAHLLRQREQVTGVESYAGDGDALRPQLARHLDGVAGAL